MERKQIREEVEKLFKAGANAENYTEMPEYQNAHKKVRESFKNRLYYLKRKEQKSIHNGDKLREFFGSKKSLDEELDEFEKNIQKKVEKTQIQMSKHMGPPRLSPYERKKIQERVDRNSEEALKRIEEHSKIRSKQYREELAAVIRTKSPKKTASSALFWPLGLLFCAGVHFYLVSESIKFFEATKLMTNDAVYLGILLELAVVVGALTSHKGVKLLGMACLAVNTIIYSYFTVYAADQGLERSKQAQTRVEELKRSRESLKLQLQLNEKNLSGYMETWQRYIDNKYLAKGLESFTPMIKQTKREIADQRAELMKVSEKIIKVEQNSDLGSTRPKTVELTFVIVSKVLLALLSFMFLGHAANSYRQKREAA